MPKQTKVAKKPAGKQQAAKPAIKPVVHKGRAVVATKGVQKKTLKPSKSKKDNPLYEKRPRNFGIGGDIQPRRDLTRFVRWPKYIRLQRQRRVLLKRLKVPPIINQFTHTIDKQVAHQLFSFLEKYSPESKKAKKERLVQIAAGKPIDTKKPKVIKYGLNHVTGLIESKRAKLVIIAHDVDPLELVIWLPTLCRKKGVPYIIVKSKARLGKVVHKKTAAALAVVDVEQRDQKDLTNFITKATENFNDRYLDLMKIDGGGVMGHKHTSQTTKEEKRRFKTEKRD